MTLATISKVQPINMMTLKCAMGIQSVSKQLHVHCIFNFGSTHGIISLNDSAVPTYRLHTAIAYTPNFHALITHSLD